VVAMKTPSSRLASAMTLLFLAVQLASARESGNQPSDLSPVIPPSISGTIPGPSIEHWIKYWVASPRNHPYPNGLISDESFPTEAGEAYIVLPNATYTLVDKLTRAVVLSDQCLKEPPTDLTAVSVGVTRHSGGRQDGCLMPGGLFCRYLTEVIAIGSADSDAKSMEPLRYFGRSAHCRL
jgi:hypothetical protein